MFRNKFIAITVSILVMVSLACSLQAAPVVVNPPAQAPAVPLETQVAEALAATAAIQTALANAVAATQAANPTNTPEFTFTPSLTPTLTFTSTPSVPMVMVSVATNCRSGPTTAYVLLGILNVGEQAQVVGRSTLTDTIIIKLPSDPAISCWLWLQNATVSGDISALPIIPIPVTPTPRFTATPSVSFDVVYSSKQWCVGLWRLKFKITNTGGTTWESDRIIATDQNTTITHTATWDDFPYYSGGCAAGSDLNLDPGEVGHTTSGGFVIDPSGHNFVATIRVCSLDGLGGTCLEKTINFTP